jgi:hypothetical protein
MFFDLIVNERAFLLFVAALFFIAGLVSPYPKIAMWFGFAVAGYSAVANDSIQTIGTFIVSNQDKKWWYLWIYIGLIFFVTVFYSWYLYDGDVSHQRLLSKGFNEAPTSFSVLQLSAPIFLIILTRLRMPVSTTFLLLNVFSSSGDAIGGVIGKSLSGYGIAFIASIIFFSLVQKYGRFIFKGKPHPSWTIAQWITSGMLWSVWVMQDAANIAIFLPRSLSVWQFLAFAIFIFLGLGFLFYLKGDRIQKIVDEKTDIKDVRAATLVDFVYAIILWYFKIISNIPMSTTWVFLGLLGGRELSMSFQAKGIQLLKLKSAFRMIGKDVLFAGIGLVVSLILAISINETIKEKLINYFFE